VVYFYFIIFGEKDAGGENRLESRVPVLRTSFKIMVSSFKTLVLVFAGLSLKFWTYDPSIWKWLFTAYPLIFERSRSIKVRSTSTQLPSKMFSKKRWPGISQPVYNYPYIWY